MTSRAVKVNLTLTSTKANAPQINTTSGTTNAKSINESNTNIESTILAPSSTIKKMSNETNVHQEAHMKQEDKQQVHTLQKTNINAAKIRVNNTQIKETTSKQQKQQEQEAAASTTKTRSVSPVTITISSNNGTRVNNATANTVSSVNITNKNSEKQNNFALAKAQQQEQQQQQQMTSNNKKDNNQTIVKEQVTENNNNINKTSKAVNSNQSAPNAQLLSLSAIPHRHVSILPSPMPSSSLEYVDNDKSLYSSTSIPIKSNIKSNVNNNNNNNKNKEAVNKESNNTNNIVKLNTTKQLQEKDKRGSLEPTNLNIFNAKTLEKATHVQTHGNNTANNKMTNVANTKTNMALQHVAMTSIPEKEETTQEVQNQTELSKPQKQRMRRRQTPSRSDRIMFQEVIATSAVKASRRRHNNNNKVNSSNNNTINTKRTNSLDEKTITSELAKEQGNVPLGSPAEHNDKTKNNKSNDVQRKKSYNSSSTLTNDLNTHANCKTENTKAASVVDRNKENKDKDIIHRLFHHHHHPEGKTKVRVKEGEVQTEEEHVYKDTAQNNENKTENVKHVNNNNNHHTNKKTNDSKANVNKCIVKEDANVQTGNSSFGDDDDKLEKYKTDGEQDEESNDSNSNVSKSYSEDESSSNNKDNKYEKVHVVNKQKTNTKKHKSTSRKPVHVQFSNNNDDDDEIGSYDSTSTNDNQEEENPLREENNEYTNEDKQSDEEKLHAEEEEKEDETNAEPLSTQVEEKAQEGQERHPRFVNTDHVHHNTNVQQQEHKEYHKESVHSQKKHHKHTTNTSNHHHHHKRQERVVNFLDALFAPKYKQKINNLPVNSHEAAACKYTSYQPMSSLNAPPPIPVRSTSTSIYHNAVNTNAHTIVQNMNAAEEEYTYEELRTQQLALEEPLFLYYSSLHAAMHLYPGDYVTIEPILDNTTIPATNPNTSHTTTTNILPNNNYNYNYNSTYPPPYKYGFYRFTSNSNTANSQTLFNYSFPPSQSAFPQQQQQQQQYQQQEIVNTKNNNDANVIIDNNQSIANNANKERIGNTTASVAQAQGQGQGQGQTQRVTTKVNNQPQQQQQQQQRVPIQLT